MALKSFNESDGIVVRISVDEKNIRRRRRIPDDLVIPGNLDPQPTHIIWNQKIKQTRTTTEWVALTYSSASSTVIASAQPEDPSPPSGVAPEDWVNVNNWEMQEDRRVVDSYRVTRENIQTIEILEFVRYDPDSSVIILLPPEDP